MDADGTHSVDQVQEMRPLFADNDVIIASRWVDNSTTKGVPFYRHIGSASINKCLSLLTGLPDNTCGYRAYSYKSLLRLAKCYGDNFITERGFVSTFEILYKMKQLEPPLRFATIPLSLDFSKRESKSKMNIKQELFAYGAFLAKTMHKRSW